MLLHPTSLPGRFGLGSFGPAARRWLGHLVDMDQRIWQVLPLGPTSYGDSPYQCLSSFALHPLLISFEDLHEVRLLTARELDTFPLFSNEYVDYGKVIPARQELLARAADRFARRPPAGWRAEFRAFLEREEGWLPDFALYAAIKEAQGLRAWTEWPAPLRRRERSALALARDRHAEAIRRVAIQQFLADRQWRRLREEANRLGIEIWGDLPIFAAHDSADVWARPDLFHLDRAGRPEVVAGVPPDYFSQTGQRWGNPLYIWDRHADEGYGWWVARLRRTLEQCDRIRIDHFRGFEAYWEIPADCPTAVEGAWRPGPGAAFFEAVRDALGGLPFIAEDLGLITHEVEALRDAFGLPGMLVLQFLLGHDRPALNFRPRECPENRAVYTGTHDNDTLLGWFWGTSDGDPRSAADISRQQEIILRDLGTTSHDIHWTLIDLALGSQARWVVVPVQDVMGLGSSARMNVPGRSAGNWRWRLTEHGLDAEARERLAACTRLHGRGRP